LNIRRVCRLLRRALRSRLEGILAELYSMVF
jgi:hypothetical protein